ncbi:hypothetical protein TWF718_002515 [Orbilia javanica]|uniref:Uncharacterized protein n=1 Tax=Orbilia javanica TaxID=47235 RepID=A0AAN8MQL4_9PEZI
MDPGRFVQQAEAAPGDDDNTQRPPKNYHLVLCGAFDVTKDGWFIGDFMGICSILKENGIGGDFLSCFPLDQYFQDSGHDSIKFGTFTGKSGAMFTYTQRQHEMRMPFYRYVSPDMILGDLLGWINRKSKEAQPGDAVSIWILSHGSRSKGLQIGNSALLPVDLEAATGEFLDGVQVNMAFSACQSHIFADIFRESSQTFRYVQCASSGFSWAHHVTGTQRRRNSRFIQAMANSISGKNLNIPRYKSDTWNIASHENYIKDQVSRKVSDPKMIADPVFFQDGVNLTSITKHVLFREFKDISYDPKAVSRRGRMEWPAPEDPAVTPQLQQIQGYQAPEDVRNAALTTLKNKYRPFLENEIEPHNCDWDFERCATSASWGDQDTNCAIFSLYIRSRIQSSVWDVVHSLAVDGYIDITKPFTHKIYFDARHPAASSIAAYLECFEKFSQFPDDLKLWPSGISGYFEYYSAHIVDWLSVVIARGMVAPVADILAYILRSEWLGGINEEEFKRAQRYAAGKIPETGDPLAAAEGYKMDVYDFFLPRGPVPDAEATDGLELLHILNVRFLQEFNRGEIFAKEYFSWSDEIVSLAKEDGWMLEFFLAWFVVCGSSHMSHIIPQTEALVIGSVVVGSGRYNYITTQNSTYNLLLPRAADKPDYGYDLPPLQEDFVFRNLPVYTQLSPASRTALRTT